MQIGLFKVFGAIAGVAGLGLGIYLLLFRSVIEQTLLFKVGLDSNQAFYVIIAFLLLTFGLAFLSLLCWMILANQQNNPIPASSLVLLIVVFAITIGSTIFVLDAAISNRAAAKQSETKRPTKVTKVCFGAGGGNNCLAGATVTLDCNQYRAGAAKPETLGANYCSWTDSKGVKQQDPYAVRVYQNNDGGGCGWTGVEVTCNPG